MEFLLGFLQNDYKKFDRLLLPESTKKAWWHFWKKKALCFGILNNIQSMMSGRLESVHLILSNKEKCTNILNMPELKENDIIDFFISLHLTLEVSLNHLFRQLLVIRLKQLLLSQPKTINVNDLRKEIETIDNIDFINKTTLFIYYSKFNFDNKFPEAAKYHSIIKRLKNFSEIRNKLFHGHSIMTIFDEEESHDSKLKEKLTTKELITQIGNFRYIMEGMRFYLDCLDSSLSLSGRESYKKVDFVRLVFINNNLFCLG